MGKGKPKGRRRGEKGGKGGEVGLAHTWRQFGQRNWSQKQSEQSRPKSLMIIPIERLRHCESKRERAYEREREGENVSGCVQARRIAMLANEQVITPVLIRFTERASGVRARQLAVALAR